MLELEVVPERSLGCDQWEFILGKLLSLSLVCFDFFQLLLFSLFSSFGGCKLPHRVFVGLKSSKNVFPGWGLMISPEMEEESDTSFVFTVVLT